MAAQARIEGAPRPDVIAVPVDALEIRTKGGARDAVWVLSEARAVRRPVEIGAVGEHLAEISSGLREGETIAAGPARVLLRLDDGERVRIASRRGE
jgi:multidrug efflux pump subunit AcrA (membrane-fusion protein)